MTIPRIDRLHLQVADADQFADMQRIWTEFASTIALPFGYDSLDFGVFDSCESDYAEMRLDHDVATIEVTKKCLNSLLERNLTLLHESLHVAAFSGRLKDMYATACGLANKYPYCYCHPTAHLLAHHMYEVDAEFALKDQYPDYARERTKYYVEVEQEVRQQDGRGVPLGDPIRPYEVLLDQLRAELAGILANDKRVEVSLSNPEQLPQGSAAGVESVRQLLSPNSTNYEELSRWGATTYEQVMKHILGVQVRGY
jgi:hypothetical protein